MKPLHRHNSRKSRTVHAWIPRPHTPNVCASQVDNSRSICGQHSDAVLFLNLLCPRLKIFELATSTSLVEHSASSRCACRWRVLDYDRGSDGVALAVENPEFRSDISAVYSCRQPFLFTSCIESSTYGVYVVYGWWNEYCCLMYVAALRGVGLHDKREGVGREGVQYGIGRIMLGHVIDLVYRGTGVHTSWSYI